MFADYQAQVLLDYQKKKAAHTLSANLTRPTPARIKAECQAVGHERYLQKDEKVLRLFVKPQEDRAAYRQAVRLADTDMFKPLSNFLKDNNIKTTDKNVELLAWLIDFEPRPYPFWETSAATRVPAGVENKCGGADGETTGTDAQKMPADSAGDQPERQVDGPAKTQQRVRNTIIGFTMIALLCGGTYLTWHNRTKASNFSPSGITGGCMYWAEDHYQPVPCNQPIENTLVVALDTLRLAHFKRITRPDTITTKSLGKVWYFKISHTLEYYTSGGFHPVHTERRLKPITAYMIHKYIPGK